MMTEYHLCKDNAMCCDDNCQACANRIYRQYMKLKEQTKTNEWTVEETACLPVEDSYFYGTNYHCPRCGEHLGSDYDLKRPEKNYCSNCGLALDWSSIKT